MYHARTLARMFAWPEYRQTSRLVRTAAISFPDVAVYRQEQGTRKFIEFLADDMASVVALQRDQDPNWHFLAGLFLHGYSGWYALEVSAGAVSDERAESFARQIIDTILAAVAAHETRRFRYLSEGSPIKRYLLACTALAASVLAAPRPVPLPKTGADIAQGRGR